MERLRLLVEGVNNKIRVLQRRAYGYRDEEYLKLKNRGGIPSAITQKCRLQPTRIRVDPLFIHPRAAVRLSRTTRSCTLPAKGYVTYRAGASFGESTRYRTR